MTTIRRDVTRPAEWIKFLISAVVVSLLLAVVVPLGRGFLEEHYTPRDYWFTYHAVEPTKPVFEIGEKLTFYSVREIRKTAEYEWHDRLFCDTNGAGGIGIRVISNYESSAILHPHSIEPPGKAWTYQSQAPETPAVCYLDSTTTAKLRYTSKVQTLKSQPFYIR